MKADAGSGKVPLDRGNCGAEKIGRSFVSRLLRLTLLALDIQEAILEGRQPKRMQLEKLTRAMPVEWESQRQLVSLVVGARMPE